ncbi:MAG: tRNA1(Val) (adenine(37)-N6)-methyltransferase [Nitrospira sp.]|nr:tRNA1(Val) (adenine(37)-N6)-methyltransferase [bacterium]MBL7048661.1 tRNA1(Val) (adenine(37)-N6)-methyltransferase [Nitrospira sp.]
MKRETLDTIKGAEIYQARSGYRFSIDAVLLENFIRVRKDARGIEFGTGSGVISILLARRLKGVRLTAIELQDALAERASRNICLNGLESRIEVLRKNIKDLRDLYPTNSFDFVYSNPPFRQVTTGRISVGSERSIARHEIEITLAELVESAAYLLNHSGRFFIVYHPFRLAELITELRSVNLEPKRMQFIHSRAGEEAKMVLVEAVKGSGVWLKIISPLCIYNSNDQYTDEVLGILAK